jgi:hypothetical protein
MDSLSLSQLDYMGIGKSLFNFNSNKSKLRRPSLTEISSKCVSQISLISETISLEKLVMN